MSLINFILDVAALLLWLSWRSIRFDPLRRATPATLVGTVRRAEPPRLKHFLSALALLLVGRAAFYQQIGPAVNWTPQIDLGLVAPAFRGHWFLPVLLFSLFSFLRTAIIFYFWLVALVVINGRPAAPDPFQKLIHLQLGCIARWPRVLLVIVPGLFVAGLWVAAHPLLVYAGVVNRTSSVAPLLGQGALVGTALYFTLKQLLPVFLFLYLIANYVFLGTSTFWDFISVTARRILAPLRRLPLRWGRIDFAPLAGIIVILLLLHVLPNLLLAQLDNRNLTLWP